MSFQGDVAGIGLGELLQGLSRGGRDGVLTLFGEQQASAIGLKKGLLFLLAGPDEKEEDWRDRCNRAYADDQNPGMETQRRSKIARAARLETIYEMLEAPNLHFRFEPGPLPAPPGTARAAISIDGDDTADIEAAYGPGMPVEYVLLEQARISDESKAGAAGSLSSYDVPRSLDPSQHKPEVRDFLEQCDGASNLEEIGDRLGWPLLQTRATVGDHLSAGNLRMAQPRELLAAAQREMELGRIGRAASRLTGWLMTTPAGPPSVGDANLLVGEWDTGRLSHILHALKPRHARALLRKLDSVHDDVRAAQERWRALFEAHRSDELAMLHEVALRLASVAEPDTHAFHDLLRLARSFQERHLESRTRTLLRLAAVHLPERPQTRIELGKRMLETGLVAEGSRWLLDTAHELLEQGDPERAMVPIRGVLHDIPDHNEAGSLLIQARALLAKKKRRRVNTMAALSIVLIGAVAAFVKFRSYTEMERTLSEINGHVSDPTHALQMIELEFGEDPPQRVIELRKRLVRLKREEEKRLYREWDERQTEIEDSVRFGDPLLGLRRTLELPAPPGDDSEHPGFSERQQLLGLLAARLTKRSVELDLPVNASIDELNQEERLIDLLEELLLLMDPKSVPPEAVAFLFRVTELRDEVSSRRDERGAAREQMFITEKQRQQDILLATGRAHAQAGDLERSLAAYDRLTESDEELAGLPTLRREIDQVRRHWEAVKRALILAERGDHESAEAELRGICRRPVEHLLPFMVESHPSGARVTMPDGRVRVTPFVGKSGIGERMDLRFESPGFRTTILSFDRPRDLVVHLHRFPERTWQSQHRVEAAPVPAGDDHIVSDRYGRLMRLDARSETKWEVELATLGGIARTPIFLPGRPGYLLVVTEDGKAWLVNAQTGATEGPRDIGSPPVDGPSLTRGGASVQFADGRVGVWSNRLEPVFYTVDNLVDGSQLAVPRGDDSGTTMLVLRAGIDSESELISPWNDWLVEVREDDYRVLAPDGKGFTAERVGDWVFVAWESPKAFVPHGRLWISDGAGLRSYLPTLEELVPYDGDQDGR